MWYYEFNEGKNALQSAGGIENVIPHFINSALPKWFSFIFLFALISAAMSTLSSQFHTMGTAFGRDFFEQLSSKQFNSLHVTRFGVIVMIIISVALAYRFINPLSLLAAQQSFLPCVRVFFYQRMWVGYFRNE